MDSKIELNSNMFQFDRKCFILSTALFCLLVFIALFVRDQFVRPFLGDVLVIWWLYLFLKSFIKIKNTTLAHIVLLIACIIEVSQFYNLVTVLGLQNIPAIKIILGATFDWLDLLAYLIGWSTILLTEVYLFKIRNDRAMT